jgi:hypothetical protein
MKSSEENVRGEVTGTWRKLHYEQINNCCPLINVITIVEARRMRWTERVDKQVR